MSWGLFYGLVAGLVGLLLLFTAVPILRGQRKNRADTLTNTQVVRQRLQELDDELAQGVLTLADKEQAEKELKLALVEEHEAQSEQSRASRLAIVIGGVAAIATGVIVYMQVNQLDRVEQKHQVLEKLPELSARLSSGDASQISTQDITDLALAIRTRLYNQPDDAQGWMFLGRLWMSVGQFDQAVEAFEKSIAIQPEAVAVQVMYAQVLMMSQDESNMRKAHRVLTQLAQQLPDNPNITLLLAMVSMELGDRELASFHYNKVKGMVDPSNPMVARLQSQLGVEKQQDDKILQKSTGQGVGFTITVDIDESLKDKLISQGYLFVFAQDALSENRMPAAVVKLSLDSFPTTVELSQSDAMIASYSLNNLSKVKLVARISPDENVAPSSGELQGMIEIDVPSDGNRSTSIVIDKELM